MSTGISPLAGKPAPASVLIDVDKLVVAYFSECPDPTVPTQRVAFGTSGHHGSAFDLSFNEWRVLAITQASCDYRRDQAISLASHPTTLAQLCPSDRHNCMRLKGWKERCSELNPYRKVQSLARKLSTPSGEHAHFFSKPYESITSISDSEAHQFGTCHVSFSLNMIRWI